MLLIGQHKFGNRQSYQHKDGYGEGYLEKNKKKKIKVN
jgi:hypothetical protein